MIPLKIPAVITSAIVTNTGTDISLNFKPLSPRLVAAISATLAEATTVVHILPAAIARRGKREGVGDAVAGRATGIGYGVGVFTAKISTVLLPVFTVGREVLIAVIGKSGKLIAGGVIDSRKTPTAAQLLAGDVVIGIAADALSRGREGRSVIADSLACLQSAGIAKTEHVPLAAEGAGGVTVGSAL